MPRYCDRLAHVDVIADTRRRPTGSGTGGASEREAQPVRRTASPQRVSRGRVIAATWALAQGIAQLGPAAGLPDWTTRPRPLGRNGSASQPRAHIRRRRRDARTGAGLCSHSRCSGGNDSVEDFGLVRTGHSGPRTFGQRRALPGNPAVNATRIARRGCASRSSLQQGRLRQCQRRS